MKKKIFYCVASALAVLTACNKNSADPALHEGEDAVVTFNLSGADFSTKAISETQSDAEKNIKDIKVFVFDSEGRLNSVGTSSGKTDCEVRISRSNNLNCYALVNTGSMNFNNVTNLQALKNHVSKMNENASDAFHMVGSKICDLRSASSVTIDVARVMSKVSVGSIKTDFAAPGLSAVTTKLKGIYLINVCGSTKFDNYAWGTDLWYNYREFDASSQTAAKFYMGEKGMNQLLSATAYVADKTMYCYPNPTTSENDIRSEPSGAAMTRLVLEVEIDGRLFFYPITIGKKDDGDGLLPNRHYIVRSVVLTGLGSDNPDVDPMFGNIQYTIQVENWKNEISEEVIF